jgi:hypothetical protein
MRRVFGRLTNLLKSPGSGRKVPGHSRCYQARLEALEQRLALAPCFLGATASVRIGDASVLEGNSGRDYAEFTVTFTQRRGGGTRTVDYATADDTATRAYHDYRRTSGTLRFASGETTKTIRVPVLGDTDVEADETFVVNLSNATGGGGGACGGVRYTDRQGIGTILDDDFADNRIDDFNDGDDAGWSHLDFTAGQPWGPATYDARSGAYTLQSAGAVPMDDPLAGTMVATWEGSRGNAAFGHGIVRGIVRANTPGSTVGFLLRANDTPGTDHDYGFYASSSFGTFYIERFDITQDPPQTILAMADPAEVPFAAGEDWYLEGRVVGGRISLKAWKVGSPEPASPLLSVRDRTFGPEDGTLLCVIAMIDRAAVTGPVQISVTVDNISFTPVVRAARNSRPASHRSTTEATSVASDAVFASLEIEDEDN